MKAQISIGRPAEATFDLRLSGSWTLSAGFPKADLALKEVEAGTPIKQLSLRGEEIDAWDSGLLTFLLRIRRYCIEKGIDLDQEGLPEGVRRLLALAAAVPERKGARRVESAESFLFIVGRETLAFCRSVGEMLDFIGEAVAAFGKLLKGKADFSRTDLLSVVQECGTQALPIVSLISLLVGLIIAFVGAVQLKMFGAQIYVADLVAIGMVRVLAAVMTGIIMAGRTGAAFAAQLGTMQVNEELDALETLGVSPMEYLVLPRILALVFMMPLLCLYADLMGVLGGMIVGVGLLDIGALQYLHETSAAITLTNLWIGLFHSLVFGVLVALAGCLRGIQCGRSASAVGNATTSAVVTGIVGIVVATAVITLICEVVGI